MYLYWGHERPNKNRILNLKATKKIVDNCFDVAFYFFKKFFLDINVKVKNSAIYKAFHIGRSYFFCFEFDCCVNDNISLLL